MKLFTSLWHWLTSSGDMLIDHAPIEQEKEYKFPKLRAKAKLRHGRQFKCDEKVKRETPPSHDLLEIEKKAPVQAGNVKQLNKRTA